jgi:single-strand DNA-binding protein
MYNKIILVGNLTRDVELRYSPAGTAIAKFGIATNRTYKDNVTGENKQEVMFIDVTVFGRSAEIANQYLRKGSKVLVEGRLVLDQWVDSSGQKRSKHSVVAEKIQFMETKAEAQRNRAGNYDNTETPAPKYEQPKQNKDIPSIDIDEDEIPF